MIKTIRKLSKFLKPYWRWAILAPLSMVLEVAMDLMQPRMVQRIIDVGIAQRDMAVVTQTGLIMIGLALIGAVGGVACTFFSVKASLGFGADLRGTLFRKVQSMSFGNLDEFETGQLITRLTNDVTQIEQVVSMLLRIMVRAPLLLVGSLVLAIVTSPRLAWLIFALMPLVFVILYWVIKRAFPMFGEVQEKLDNLNTVMQENLAGVRLVKAFVRDEHETQRFRDVNEDLMSQTVLAMRTAALGWPFVMLMLNLGVVGAIWFGGRQVIGGTLEVGALVAFINYLMRTLMSMLFVSMLTMRMARAQASAERVDEVLESEPQVKNRGQTTGPFRPQGEVVFDDVTFSYNGKDHAPVLKGLSFRAESGQLVAILGATGSGKSSLIHLIPRFYDVNGGRITIDGVDVRDLDKEALRRTIGIALQESVLFTGTIRDNIRYGRPDASDDEVIAAAKAAQAHDFITELPDGYETELGQRGVNLSGGQKQRVAIARALLVEPTILILDDSTSSVDVETETKIQEALDALMKNRTSFVVAQRISTVLKADKILVLDDGAIVGEGSHHELLEHSPIYREIYESQLGNGANTYG